MAKKLSAALLKAFAGKAKCDAAFTRKFKAMQAGEGNYSPSKLASLTEKCDDANDLFWKALKKEMLKYPKP
ncbi:MAG: hypothetical protein ABI905_01535 [Betaproteobacteria bacterium]